MSASAGGGARRCGAAVLTEGLDSGGGGERPARTLASQIEITDDADHATVAYLKTEKQVEDSVINEMTGNDHFL